MTIDLTGSFVTIDDSNKQSDKTSVQQLVDIVQSDIASVSENTRKSYEVFTSGGIDLATITSSMYQTVYDQDFSLGTANPLFDITVGSLSEYNSDTDTFLVNGQNYTADRGGKLETPDNVAMIREKVSIYKQFAQNLLGNANASFFTPHDAIQEDTDTTPPKSSKKIRGAVFICFRRLFTRDNIYKTSFGLKIYKKASSLFSDFVSIDVNGVVSPGGNISNINSEVLTSDPDSSLTTALIYDDKLSASNLTISPVAGELATLSNSSGEYVGIIYYDSGIIVLDAERAFDPTQTIRGLITSTRSGNSTIQVNGPFYVYGNTAANPQGYYFPLYTTDVDEDGGNSYTSIDITVEDDGNTTTFYYDAAGNNSLGVDTRPDPATMPYWKAESSNYYTDDTSGVVETDGGTLHNGNFYPSLWTSGTIDDIVDHVCSTRFGRAQNSGITFRNETVINSSLIFCRAAPSQFNYSTNPTYTDDSGNIIALDSNDNSFTYVTTIGLYDAEGSLLAVAKTSRPILKNASTDLSIRIRLDY